MTSLSYLRAPHPGAPPHQQAARYVTRLQALEAALRLLSLPGVSAVTLHTPEGRVALDADKVDVLLAAEEQAASGCC